MHADPERYDVREAIGAGAFGTVYRAHDRRLGRQVALKIITTDRLDAETLRRVHREARLAAAFRHPTAVDDYETGELDGRPYIAMELLEGASLATLLRQHAGPVAIAAIVEIGRAIAEVLAAAHAEGLVHRDVKPANIFVDGTLGEPGRVRLVDFGLAFHVAPSSETLGRLTEDGIPVGTPAYMSPEQVEGVAIPPRADVYALGCLLYELASGRPPFIGNIPKILTGHLYLPPIPLPELELDRTIPSSLNVEIMRMLAKQPDDRPEAHEVASRLAAIDVSELRSGTLDRTRAERCVPELAAPELAPSDEPIRIVTVDLAPDALSALLGTIVLTGAVEAQAIVVMLADDAAYPAPPRADLPIIGLHPAPSPRLISEAIRAGLAAVVRWPGEPAAFRKRVLAALRSRRIPRE